MPNHQCPLCQATLHPHCSNPQCDWEKCEYCKGFGIPGVNFTRFAIEKSA